MMRRHAFGPDVVRARSGVTALGLFILLGDWTAADIGWKMDVARAAGRPRPAVRDLSHPVVAQREFAELGSERVDEETVSPDEDERWLVPFVAVGFAVRR
jgi:hypothetical protein